MSRLSSKVAIVTGASKGIGAGIATALGAAGARGRQLFIRPGGAERVAKAIIANGSEAIAVAADVSKSADVVRLFKEVDSAFGRLDILVNNAGVFRFGPFAETTQESFHRHYDINVLGPILTVQEAIKRFGADGGSKVFSHAPTKHTVASMEAGQVSLEEQANGQIDQAAGPRPSDFDRTESGARRRVDSGPHGR